MLPDSHTILNRYYSSLYSVNTDVKDVWLNKKLKELDNPNKMICTCYRICLKKNYNNHLLSKVHIARNNVF